MVYYQINFLEQTKSNLIAQRQAFIDGELGEIQNDYMVNPELPSQNTQTVNDIYINFLEAGDDTTVIMNNYTNILSIANQCPAAGGLSVYRARAMLALVNDSLEYSDAITCLQSGIYKESLSVTNNLLNFSIIPNPANNSIELVFDNKPEGNCQINILNVLGQECFIKDLDCEKRSHFIDVSNLTNGIYFIVIKLNNNESEIKKLVITR